MNREHPSPDKVASDPQSAVLKRLAVAYDHFIDAEEMHKLLGNDGDAEDARQIADRIMRAYRAENEDPSPRSWDPL
jgi:hypothetical protein